MLANPIAFHRPTLDEDGRSGPAALTPKYTSANHYASALIRLAVQKGLDADHLLDSAGIAPELLNQPRARILTDQVSELVRQIWRGLEDENMGLSPRPCKPGVFHMMGKLVVHSPNLEKALLRGIHYYQLVQDDFTLSLTQEGEEATISLQLAQPALDPEHLLSELVMLAWQRLASWLIDQNIVMTRASFTYPAPPHINEYKHLFPCPHRFEQATNSFSFSSTYLKRSVTQTENSLKTFIQNSPTNLFVQHHHDESLTTKIRMLIESQVADGIPDLVTVSDHLGASKQTLRLKLRAEGTSYQQIKNLVRRDLAIHYLTQHQAIPVSKIAQRVGFSEPGVFCRAFKGWTGLTPGDYRHGDASN